MSRRKVKNVYQKGRGVVVRTSKATYALDRVSGVRADYHVVSHAHSDHLPSTPCGEVIASEETLRLSRERGLTVAESGANEDVELINSGHILGSTACLIEDEILYTGDLNPRDRLFLEGFEPPQASTLILESTYGRTPYEFDDFSSVVEEVSSYVLNMLNNGQNIVAHGYALGKAQILTSLLSWYDNLKVSEEVQPYNDAYRELGVRLNTHSQPTTEEELEDAEEPWIFLTSPSDPTSRALASERGALRLFFTGWAVNSGYNRNSNFGASFPLSDHADFSELVEVARGVDPDKIYTFHGFSRELASELRRRGFDAEALDSTQRSLTDFDTGASSTSPS